MTDRYGPQTAQIEALLDRVHNLTDDEARAVRDVSIDAWVGRGAARNAARNAALDAAYYAADYAVARRATADAGWLWSAGKDAVLALVVRDLIGQHGFTQEHYDILVRPWESVVGTEWTREANDD